MNLKQRRVGHLFQDRYKAILFEKDAYLLERCRYIVLDPVHARMIDFPVNEYVQFVEEGGNATIWDNLQHQCFQVMMILPRSLNFYKINDLVIPLKQRRSNP